LGDFELFRTASRPRRFLRAQQLYSDCVYERQEQIREKEVMKLWEKEKEKAYHEDVMRHVAEGDRREAAELEARKLKNAVICKQQQAQLAEFRENYLERLRIEKRDGELIQKKVARISVSLVFGSPYAIAANTSHVAGRVDGVGARTPPTRATAATHASMHTGVEPQGRRKSQRGRGHQAAAQTQRK
jgi:hypothetical protein